MAGMDLMPTGEREIPANRQPGRSLLWPWVMIALMAGAMLLIWQGWRDWRQARDPRTVMTSALQSLREQNVLVPFAARYVAVVSSEQSRYGLSARKTLIMPGTVRYEVDLGALTARSVGWDAASRTLSVTLPPIRVSQPEIDLAQVREFQQGAVLFALTDAESQLDAANRAHGQQELRRLASEPLPMRLAANAAKTAIRQNFELPLKAAGLDATVTVRFVDEGQPAVAGPAAGPATSANLVPAR